MCREMADILKPPPRNIKAYIEKPQNGQFLQKVEVVGMVDTFESKVLFSPPCLDQLEYSALLLAEEFLTKANGFICEHEIKTAFSKIKQLKGNYGQL